MEELLDLLDQAFDVLQREGAEPMLRDEIERVLAKHGRTPTDFEALWEDEEE